MADIQSLSDEELQSLYHSMPQQDNGISNLSDEELKSLYKPATGNPVSDLLSKIMNQVPSKNGDSGILPDYALKDIRDTAGYGLMLSPLGELPAIGAAASKIPYAGKIAKPISDVLSRYGINLGQAAIGSNLVNDQPVSTENIAKNAKEQALPTALFEGLTWPFRLAGKAAEFINPQKFAGNIAERIRNLAQSGYDEAKEYYNPVHAKYDENWLTADPEKYLGFHPEDKQYFKPVVNKAYRDVLAEPSFKNFHALQSEMGRYPELAPLRNRVKSKMESYLSQDPVALLNYKTGSDVMRDKYYPYVSNDVLSDIAEYKKPIKQIDPNKLSKALENTRIVDEAKKSAVDISHPLVDMNNALKNRLAMGQAAQYGIPMAGAAVGGELLHPGLGFGVGAPAAAMFAKFIEPSLVHFAQNPSVVDKIQKIMPLHYGAGRLYSGLNTS